MTIYGTYSQTCLLNNAILASVWQDKTVGDQIFEDSTRYKGAWGLVDASKNPKNMAKENGEFRAFDFIFVVSIVYRYLYLKINVCLRLKTEVFENQTMILLYQLLFSCGLRKHSVLSLRDNPQGP